MTEEMSRKWLASPVRYIRDYSDWPQMNPVMAAFYDAWRDEPRSPEFMSVGEFLDGTADYSRHFCAGYDAAAGAYLIADPAHKSSMLDIAAAVASLRGASDFAGGSAPGFIYVFPALSGGDPEVLLEISPGRSVFRYPHDPSPEVMYFMNEAEEYICSLLEDDDD
jgi:hypothetical protein